MDHNPTDTEFSETTKSFDKPYIRLRTVLDALEANALHYILKDKSVEVRIKRAKEIEAFIMPILQLIGGVPDTAGHGGSANLVSGGCPEGFNDCGGCCVPYACPESQLES